MKNFTLTINLEEGTEISELKKLQRHYQAIKFTDDKKPLSTDLVNILKKIGANIKTVNYSGSTNFVEVMSHFPALEAISIEETFSSRLDVASLSLPNLKNLELVDYCFDSTAQLASFMSMFPTVKHLHMNRMLIEPSDLVHDLKSKFKNLDTLTITGPNIIIKFFQFLFLIIYPTAGYFDVVQSGVFDNLQALTLKSFDGIVVIDWAEFISNHPKLEIVDIEINEREENFDFIKLVSSARDGMKLKIQGKFQLTENRLRQFKQNPSQGVRLQVPKSSLKMTEKKFEEIMEKQKNQIEIV